MHAFEGILPIAKGGAKAAPALLIPFIILGGILGGIFTPTEAGAVAVIYTLIIGTFYYRTLDMKNLIEAMIGTAKVTASALVIVSTAIVFSRILTFFRIPQEILELLIAISDNRVIMALILIGFFLIMGTFMDALANMIILVPLLMPVAIAEAGLGMTEIQFGLFLMISLLLGLITPPLGLLLFITGPIAKESLEKVSLAVIPFLVAELVVLLLIVFVPSITMAIPRALGLGG